MFGDEAGGHRWQRTPPTEKRGRRQTSTITVAVLTGDESVPDGGGVDPNDVEESYYRGTGKGGQHRNKHANNCRLVHRPSGLRVQAEGRSRSSNRQRAYAELERRLAARIAQLAREQRNATKASQVGSGMRGDKRRTVVVHRDEVVDHEAGWSTTYKRYARGDWPPA